MIYTEDFFAQNSPYPNDDLVQLVDNLTKENVNYKKVTAWMNGTPINSSNEANLIDGKIYRKKGTDYYVNTLILSGSELNAGLFGVKADGVTDDSDALQKAFDFCGKNGWKLKLPIGEIVITKNIQCDMPANPDKANKFQLIGSGVNVTVLNSIGTTGGLRFVSNSSGGSSYLTISGLTIRRPFPNSPAAGGVGIYVSNVMEITIKDVEVFKFNLGMQIMDTCSSLFENVKTHWGDTGFYGGMSNITPPNLLTFINCHFNSNAVKGVELYSVHNVKFDGCGFEGNYGNALEASFVGANGKVGLNLINSYFEGTSNGVDIYYTLNSGGTANFIGNTFNRLTSSIYTSVFVLSNTAEKSYLNFVGNGFLNGGKFIPNGDKPAVLITGNTANIHYTDTNYYETASDELICLP
ncbi:right-handed parallel beta-helix repeat-containing protein [Chryseobacterium sp. Bi04]|uniref:right-handed parallel beta-helix repeat-containing protein n=1 Tax=Chryseobacterium sp. Bi04 TaxID=2822345 RepID=UPI001D486CA8|nr:right-handed parallel beta-helix repeat-containing protein [Chryseobacterium sp. Bi04]CAH0255082.1 hypothetical protein SRABI04_03333 [Chryseobacterium sp. Bi04]